MNRPYPESLTATALLGIARSTTPLSGLHTEAAATALDGDPASILLAAAALEAAFLAGAGAPTTLSPPEPAPDDPRPRLSDAAAARLRSLLVVDSSLLTEWFDATAGFRPPPEMLGELLDAALRRTAHRERLVALAGPRGQWLADRNPDWAPLREPDPTDDEDWRHGTPAARRRWFTTLRRTDPSAATALLTSGWRSENADMRAALVAMLADGLGPADEPLLEQALDDRSQRVRQAAVGVLRYLPGTAYGQRMARRLREWVTVADGVVTVTLPGDLDDAARRDGLDDRTARRLDPVLTLAVQAAPLAVWGDVGVVPEDLPHLTVAEPFTSALEYAWSVAVADQGDTDWALALLRRDGTVSAPVAARLPRDVVVARVLATRDGAVPDGNLLEALPAPWPHDVAAAVLAAVYAARAPLPQLRHPVDLLGHRAPFEFESVLSEAATRAGDLDRLALFAAAADTLTHRRHLHQELT
ncbi:DUF5691 domain-containing protein [Prescottella defluvii]|uniref:DUF5691 domain-containing protein n=1 Tax=Prescottella defluvii TaxID=1323361 RepID=UPI0004F372C3|nr:DUF5691 domain-containing protein [Prescottella defluvii]